jgi:hypothetical protein
VKLRRGLRERLNERSRKHGGGEELAAGCHGLDWADKKIDGKKIQNQSIFLPSIFLPVIHGLWLHRD